MWFIIFYVYQYKQLPIFSSELKIIFCYLAAGHNIQLRDCFFEPVRSEVDICTIQITDAPCLESFPLSMMMVWKLQSMWWWLRPLIEYAMGKERPPLLDDLPKAWCFILIIVFFFKFLEDTFQGHISPLLVVVMVAWINWVCTASAQGTITLVRWFVWSIIFDTNYNCSNPWRTPFKNVKVLYIFVVEMVASINWVCTAHGMSRPSCLVFGDSWLCHTISLGRHFSKYHFHGGPPLVVMVASITWVCSAQNGTRPPPNS